MLFELLFEIMLKNKQLFIMINYEKEQYQKIKRVILTKVEVKRMMCVNCEERIA